MINDNVIRPSINTMYVCALTILFYRYYTERYNPDPNMTPYYESVPMAMWITMLNLSGEAPLCDYTLWGKVTLI